MPSVPLLSLARFCSFVTQFVDTPARFAGRRWTTALKAVGLDWLVPEMGDRLEDRLGLHLEEVEEEDHLLAILLDPVMGALK